MDPDKYSRTEQFCTLLGYLVFTVNATFPFVVSLLYCCKMKRADPLPDLNDMMSLEELRFNYGTINIQEIHRTAYTESKHEAFMAHYGRLLEEVDTRKLGKVLSIATVFIYIFRKFIVAFCVVSVAHPVFNIFMFNFTSLFVLMWIVYLEPFTSLTFWRIRVIQELVTMGINYHLFCFTDWVSIERRVQIGNSVIYIIAGQSVFFIIWGIIPMFESCALRCKRDKALKKARIAAKKK